MIEPYCYKNHRGRRVRGIKVMFRMYVFHVIKGIFGFRKTCYKGFAKLILISI